MAVASARPRGRSRSALRDALDDARMYARFAWGLRGFLRHPISVEQAREIVRLRLEQREASFLRVAERGIYGYPRSPYLPLLKLAGCTLGDLRQMVRSRGLEETLGVLRREGVYVSFEEFKGRQPIVRQGRVLAVDARDFDDPFPRGAYEGSTGGTTGAGTRVNIDLDFLALMATHVALIWETHGVYGAPHGLWCGILPDSSGLMVVLTRSRFGIPPRRWFTPLDARDLHPALKYRLATWGTVALGRAVGVPLPRPERVPLDQAEVIARWMARTIRTHGRCVLSGNIGMAMRVSAAARREGLSLAGGAFFGGGEPPTPAKVREVTASGAHWIPLYGSQEAGQIALACARPADGNDLHVAKDALALIQYPRPVPGSDVAVPAFHFTGLV